MACEKGHPASAVRRLRGWLLFALLAVTLAVFAGVGGNEFVHFDDNINIYENPHLKGLSVASLKWMFTDASYARRYMPLGWLSYAVDQQCFGLNPRMFHAGSLLLHLGSVLALFLLLARLLRMARAGLDEKFILWGAAGGALCWAVNPLRVEAVAWASARIYCQATLLALLWVLCWLRAHDEALTTRARRLSYWGSVALYAASLLTYPLALFAPVLLFALEVCVLRRAGLRLADWLGPDARRLWKDKLPFLALAAAGLMLTVWARTGSGEYNKPVALEHFGMFPRAMQACYLWAYYLWKPWAPFHLSPVYPTLHGFDPLSWPFVGSAALLVAVSAWLFSARRQHPGWFALWCCHLVVLVPFLGLSEYNHSAADRYSYLHGTLWSAVIAFALSTAKSGGQRGPLRGLATAAACALLGLVAWQQVAIWRDTIPLHRHLVARLGSDPARARYDEVLGVHCLRAGLTNDAIASFQDAIRFGAPRADRPADEEGILARSHLSIGNILARQGEPARAIEHYEAALRADPASASASVNLGMTLAGLRRFEEAQGCFETALRHNPDSISAHHNLGTLLRQQGREADALGHFEAARRLLARK